MEDGKKKYAPICSECPSEIKGGKESVSYFFFHSSQIIKFCLQALYFIDAPETANGHFQIGKFMDVSPDS